MSETALSYHVRDAKPFQREPIQVGETLFDFYSNFCIDRPYFRERMPELNTRDINSAYKYIALSNRGVGVIPDLQPVGSEGQPVVGALSFYKRSELRNSDIYGVQKYLSENYPEMFSTTVGYTVPAVRLEMDHVQSLVDEAMFVTGLDVRMAELDSL